MWCMCARVYLSLGGSASGLLGQCWERGVVLSSTPPPSNRGCWGGGGGGGGMVCPSHLPNIHPDIQLGGLKGER